MHFPQATFPASTILSWGQRCVFFKNSSKLCLGILERIIFCCALEHLALIWVDSSICVEMSSICYISVSFSTPTCTPLVCYDLKYRYAGFCIIYGFRF